MTNKKRQWYKHPVSGQFISLKDHLDFQVEKRMVVLDYDIDTQEADAMFRVYLLSKHLLPDLKKVEFRMSYSEACTPLQIVSRTRIHRRSQDKKRKEVHEHIYPKKIANLLFTVILCGLLAWGIYTLIILILK